jgi:pimeloyl-ACP methyl ester carboxylesterase
VTFYLTRRLRTLAIIGITAGVSFGVAHRLLEARDDAPDVPTYASPGDLQPIDCWFDTASDATCAWLHPTGQNQARDTALPVVILAPAGTRSGRRVSIQLSGGPGGPSYLFEEGIAAWRDWMQRLGLDHDLVLYDTRGTGYAVPELPCSEFEPMLRDQLAAAIETPAQRLATWNAFERVLQRCVARVPAADRAAALISTRQHARDLLDLIVALRRDHGYQDVVLYGVSYGSRLATWAANQARTPQHQVQRMVLDSYYPPGVDLDVRTPRNWREVLSDFATFCARHGDCTGSGADLAAKVERLVAAAPRAHEVIDVDLGELWGEQRHVALRLDGYNYAELLMHALYVNLRVEELPLRVDEALAGEWSPAWDELARSYLETMLDPGFGNVAFALAECADNGESSPAEIEAMHREEPVFAHLIAEPPQAAGLCRRLGAPDVSLRPHSNPTPALVVAMQLDPVTPWRVAQAALAELPQAHWRLLAGAGHGVADQDECAARAIGRYMNSGRTPDFESCDVIDARDPE